MDKYWHWLKSWNWDIDDEYAWIILIIKGFAWVCFAILGLELACVYYLFAFFINIIMGNYKWQNLPNGICKIGFILTLMLLVLFYTGSWIKNSYNQCWAVVLTISYILTFVGFYYYAKQKNYVKQKDTLFNKVCEITTITGIASIIGAFPMMILGYLISAIFFGNDNPRMVQALCYGWSITSVVLCFSQIPKMIDFNAIRVNYLYSKGDKLYDKGKYKEAIEVYNKAKGLDTSNSPYYFYAMGLAYLGLNDYTQALYKFERAIKINDSYPEFYYAIADTCLESNDYETGLDYIDKLLNKLDKDSKNYKECEQFKADYIKRKEKLDHECNSDKARELYEQATRYKNFSEYGKANNCIKQALELTPDNEDYNNLLSEIQQLHEKESAKIEELYNEAVNLSDSKNYKAALKKLDNALIIAKKQDINTTKLNQFKKELQGSIDSIYLAKEKYTSGINYKNAGEYKKAIWFFEESYKLNPDDKKCVKTLNETKELYNTECNKVEVLYNEALNLSDSRDYKTALKKTEEAITIANKQEFSNIKLNVLNKELIQKIDTLNIAEEKYNAGMKAYKEKDYTNAIYYLERAVSFDSENIIYKDNLEKIKQDFEDTKRFGKEFYDKALESFNNNELDKAMQSINAALGYMNDNSYRKLKLEIEAAQKKFEDKKEAEKLYEKALDMYNSNDLRFDMIIEKLQSAITKNKDSKYSDLLKKVETTKAEVEADNFYKKAQKEYENEQYEQAINYAKESVKLCPSNQLYIDFKQKLDWEYKEYKNNKEAQEFFNEGVVALNNADFTNAVSYIEEAIKLKPENEEWQKVLEKAKTGRIDITTCTKNALMTLDFIDNEKAEQIIKARNDGNIWYGYEEFAQAFSLQPHQYADIEAKISFPLKQGNKYGRRLDW